MEKAQRKESSFLCRYELAMGVFSFHSFVKTGRFLHFHCSRVKKHLSRGCVKIFHLCRGAQKEILFLVIMHKHGLYVYSLFVHSNATD